MKRKKIPTESQPQQRNDVVLDRRQFLKTGAAGTAVGALSLTGMASSGEATVEKSATGGPPVKKLDDFPHKISSGYRPAKQKENVHNVAWFRKHPEMNKIGMQFYGGEYLDTPGYTHLDAALAHGAMQGCVEMSGPSPGAVPGYGLHSWAQLTKEQQKHPLDMNFVSEDKHKFKTRQEASNMVKRAAQFYGASLVGITQRDKRWDYETFWDPMRGQQGKKPEYGWEEFPFEPKSVIVLAFEMDYEIQATAPSRLGEGGPGDGYTKMTKTAFQLSVFLKQLGYKAVAAGNDLGLSVPYAIAAGLGESSRMGIVVSYKYGPRIRLAKVYTDLDFFEYDSPVDFGVKHFCESCMRCAEACPAKCISKKRERTMKPDFDASWGDFDPGTGYANPGVEKWYVDAKKCFEFWCKDHNGCGACITSCPYNKPDFWHHRMVDKLTALMPGPVHGFMREMDILFGYGNISDPQAAKKFWNSKGRKYLGYK